MPPIRPGRRRSGPRAPRSSAICTHSIPRRRSRRWPSAAAPARSSAWREAASDETELDEALLELAETPTAVIAERYGIGEERARTLPAGAAILAGIQSLLGTPLRVQRGGLREGALLSLAAEHAVAA